MKRFIIISLLTAMTTVGRACVGGLTHNYYLFSTYNREDFTGRMNQICLENWMAYLHKPSGSYYYFDAKEVADYARSKNDQTMITYVENLQVYLDYASRLQESWDYPSKEELAARSKQLERVRTVAQQKQSSALRSQFGLLFMRCNMALGRHQENIDFWEQKASGYIETVYKDMMKNIYAGALLKSGRGAEATKIYAEQGDERSLMTCFYEKRSMVAISQEYQRDANSPALPFLVQDFVNNVQECMDIEGTDGWPSGKLFVRDIKRSEAQQMCQLCEKVVSEGKTMQPALWKSAQAWIHYLLGDKQQAFREANQAVTLGGSDRIVDNARVVLLYVKADQSVPDAAFDNYLARELKWLEEKAQEERKVDGAYRNHYSEVYDRLVNQVLVSQYEKVNRPEVATALLGVADEQEKQATPDIEKQRQMKGDYRWNPDYDGVFFRYIDTMAVAQLQQYYLYLRNSGGNELDCWLQTRVRRSDEFLSELIGTKYLRVGQWQQAIKWLEQVPLTFVNTQNITPYAARRSYKVEPWLKEQKLKWSDVEPGSVQVTVNQKLDFAREMQQLESGYYIMQGAQRFQRAYDLAVRYYQASFRGDSWYLTRYGKSITDGKRGDELDFTAKTIALLTTAKQTTSLPLKEKTLFALAFVPDDLWYTNEWNNTTYEYEKRYHRQSRQYLALQDLSAFVRQNQAKVSPYVSRCDVLKQFMKQR